jgi:hypothetical protein
MAYTNVATQDTALAALNGARQALRRGGRGISDVSDGYAPLILPCGRWCVQFLADLNVYVLTGESRTCSL